MPQRQCTKEKAIITSPIKCITLPMPMEKYRQIVDECGMYRNWVDQVIMEHPELFPKAIGFGYTLHDDRTSDKLEDVRLRRICLKALDENGKKQVFTIAPSVVPAELTGNICVHIALGLSVGLSMRPDLPGFRQPFVHSGWHQWHEFQIRQSVTSFHPGCC